MITIGYAQPTSELADDLNNGEGCYYKNSGGYGNDNDLLSIDIKDVAIFVNKHQVDIDKNSLAWLAPIFAAELTKEG